MANQAGRPIAPARKLVAAVMGTIAVFVMAVGLGMSSWAVVIFGVALLALSIALGVVNVVRRGARAWVVGTAQVKGISPAPTSSAVYGRAEIAVLVIAPGLQPSEVTIRDPRVPVVKWPMPGDTLPITVDVDDLRRVKINWDEAAPQDAGADPPPPPAPDYAGTDPEDDLDNDLLGDVEPPPWATRDLQWGRGPDEPPTEYQDDYPDGAPVVVHETPAGMVVEGELVGHEDAAQRLPRRAAATPSPEATDTPAPPDPDTTTSPAAEPEADPEPAEPPRRPAGSAGSSYVPDPDYPPPPPPGRAAPDSDYPPPPPPPPRRAPADPGSGSGSGSGGGYPRPAPGPRSDPPPASTSAYTSDPTSGAASGPASDSPSGPTSAYASDSPSGPTSGYAFDSPSGPASGYASDSPSGPTSGYASDSPSGPTSGYASDSPSGPTSGYASDSPSGPASGYASGSGGSASPGSGSRPSPGPAYNPASRPSPRPRPTGERPSPRPRGGTATATLPPQQKPAGAAPTQRTGHPDDALPIDLPLDDPDPGFQPTTTTAARSTAPADQAPPPADAPPTEMPWTDAPRSESSRTEATRSESSPTETPRPEPSRTEPPRAEPSLADTPRAEVPRVEMPQPRRRPEPTQSATNATPSPMSAFPTAPAPTTGPPTAPRPDRPARPAPAPEPVAIDDYDDIDLPLFGDPAPETTPAASAAVADDVIAPPAETAPPREPAPAAEMAEAQPNRAETPNPEPTRAETANPEPTRAETANPEPTRAEMASAEPTRAEMASSEPIKVETANPELARAESGRAESAVPARTKFVSNAAHDASAEAKSGGMVAGAAAAVTAVAAAAVAAVRKVGKHDETTPEAAQPAPAPAPENVPEVDSAVASAAPVGGAWADRPVTPEPDERAGDLLTAYPSARPGPTGAIHGVGITILVSDLDRSIAFYRDTLGFYEIDRGDGSAVLASGDTRLVLRTVPGRSTEAGRQIYLNLEVGDVEAIYRELLAKDVPFVHPPRAVDRGDRLELWSATFRDPDDHTVAITQWRAIR